MRCSPSARTTATTPLQWRSSSPDAPPHSWAAAVPENLPWSTPCSTREPTPARPAQKTGCKQPPRFAAPTARDATPPPAARCLFYPVLENPVQNPHPVRCSLTPRACEPSPPRAIAPQLMRPSTTSPATLPPAGTATAPTDPNPDARCSRRSPTAPSTPSASNATAG